MMEFAENRPPYGRSSERKDRLETASKKKANPPLREDSPLSCSYFGVRLFSRPQGEIPHAPVFQSWRFDPDTSDVIRLLVDDRIFEVEQGMKQPVHHRAVRLGLFRLLVPGHATDQRRKQQLGYGDIALQSRNVLEALIELRGSVTSAFRAVSDLFISVMAALPAGGPPELARPRLPARPAGAVLGAAADGLGASAQATAPARKPRTSTSILEWL